MTEDLSDKLKELETTSTRLREQINESANVLDAIEAKIADLKSRQKARMYADQRINNSVIDNMRTLDEASVERKRTTKTAD